MKTEIYNNILIRRIFILTIVSLFGLIDVSYGQDPIISQFYNNPIYYNPAYTGSNPGMRARLNYRNQWNKLPTDYNNYTLAIDAAEPNLPGAGGLGLVFQSDFDGFGNIKTTSASLVTSVKVEFSESFLAMYGLGASFVQKTSDWNGMVFSDQLDPRYGIVHSTAFQQPDFYKIYYPDFGTGLLFRFCESSEYFKKIIATFSFGAQHVFRPDISFTGTNKIKLPVKMVITGDLLLDNDSEASGPRGNVQNKASSFKLNPGFLYERQGDMSNFSIGLNAYKSFIYSGLWIRSQSFTFTNIHDLIVMVGANIPFTENSTIKVRYSYDYVLSGLRRSVGTTHEISLLYELSNFSIFGQKKSSTRVKPGTQHSCSNCPLF